MPAIYDNTNEVWKLFYTAYRAKPNDKSWNLNYDGRIFLAVSTVPGLDGIGGPYVDKGVVLQPDSTSGDWEGHQGTDSFHIFPAKNGWLAFHGSAKSQVYPCEYWGVGLATAPTIDGPWRRLHDISPLDHLKPLKDDGHPSRHVENPVVTLLDNGLYVAVFDCELPGKVGYAVSRDGLKWSKGSSVAVTHTMKKDWLEIRTPLSLIRENKDENKDIYTMFFTGQEDWGMPRYLAVIKLKMTIGDGK
jgi:hypothetical protein